MASSAPAINLPWNPHPPHTHSSSMRAPAELHQHKCLFFQEGPQAAAHHQQWGLRHGAGACACVRTCVCGSEASACNAIRVRMHALTRARVAASAQERPCVSENAGTSPFQPSAHKPDFLSKATALSRFPPSLGGDTRLADLPDGVCALQTPGDGQSVSRVMAPKKEKKKKTRKQSRERGRRLQRPICPSPAEGSNWGRGQGSAVGRRWCTGGKRVTGRSRIRVPEETCRLTFDKGYP